MPSLLAAARSFAQSYPRNGYRRAVGLAAMPGQHHWTEEQRECLEALGCRTMQGFLFARPMPAADFFVWLKAQLKRG